MGDRQRIPWTTLTMKDLRAIAAEATVLGRASMRRSELLRAIQKASHDPQVRELVQSKIAGKASGSKLRGRSVARGAPVTVPPNSTSPPPALPADVPLQVAVHVDRGKPIPDAYGDDRLRFMIRDPWSGFTYWELAGPRAERMRLAYGAEYLRTVEWRLRVTSLLTRTWSDMPVDVHACRAYVALHPGRLYLAHLGFLDANASFVEVLRAGPAHTPRASVSPVVDEEWPVDACPLAALVADMEGTERGRFGPTSIGRGRWWIREASTAEHPKTGKSA